MKALQLVGWQKPLELREVPVPEPGPGEVLLKIGGAGACHSDLHLMEAPEGSASVTFPFTLGHENAGWVEKLGPGAAGYAVGDPVLVYGPWGCGRCLNCRTGMENYCESEGVAKPGGLGRNGGMANYLIVPSTRFLIPLDDLDPREAAPLSDAALTSYHAVKRSLHLLGAGSTAVVIGAGGLGQMAIQVLRALSAATTIIAMDTAPDKLATAKRMGADEALVSGDDAVKRIKDVTHGQGANLVLDMVGIDPTLKMAAQLARALGHVTIVGLGGGALPVNFFSLPHECAVTAPYWGSIPELVEHIRSNNEPEFIAKALQARITAVGAQTAYITPGRPWENGYIESFNARLQDEFLNGEIFYTLQEAKILIEARRRYYNTIRPHSALGYRPSR